MIKILIDKETVELAFEALSQGTTDMRWKAITALRQALEQSTEQEPVVAMADYIALQEKLSLAIWDMLNVEQAFEKATGAKWVSKSNTPQPQEAAPRKPLTDEEIESIAKNYALSNPTTPLYFARAIETAHGITGEKE